MQGTWKSLASWPNEVLASLSFQISGYDIGRLYLTGDSVMRQKLEQGGVQCFHLAAREEVPKSGIVAWPRLARKLKGLTTFILDAQVWDDSRPRPISRIRPDLLPPTVTELRLVCLQAERCFMRHPPAFEYLFPHQLDVQTSVDLATFTDSEEFSSETEEKTERWEDERGKLVPEAKLNKRIMEAYKERSEQKVKELRVYSQKRYKEAAWQGSNKDFFNFGAFLPSLRTLSLHGDPVWTPDFLLHLPPSLTQLDLQLSRYRRLYPLRALPEWKVPDLSNSNLLRLSLGDRQPFPPPEKLVPIFTHLNTVRWLDELKFARAVTHLSFNLGSALSINVALLPRTLHSLTINFIRIRSCFEVPSSTPEQPQPWPISLTSITATFAPNRRILPPSYPPHLKSLSLQPLRGGDALTEAEAAGLPVYLQELEVSSLISVASLHHITNLRSLHVEALTGLSEKSIFPPRLTQLDFGRFDVLEPVLKAILAGLPDLKRLDIRGQFSSSISASFPRRLEHLSLWSPTESFEEEFMLHMPLTVKYLSIACSRFNQLCLERLPPTLTFLEVHGKIRHPSPMVLAKLPRTLTQLDVPAGVYRACLDEAWGLLPPALAHYDIIFPFSIAYDIATRLPPCLFILQDYQDNKKLKKDSPEE